MGTIAEKLNYLNDTRLKIKDSLNKFGSNITENDTFRSYSNVINDIYDKLPKVSGNGSDFSLENAQNGKLDSFGMDGNTEQTTYTGKNLLSYTSYGEEQQGILTTYDSNDGALILNGTASDTFSNITKESNLNISTGTYTFSISEAKNYNIRLRMIYTDNTNVNATIYKGSTSTSVNITKAVSTQRIFIYENDTLPGTTFTNEKIYVQLESGSTATTFEPYVGGTPSPNPDYPQDIRVVENEQVVNVHGKNLFDKDNANIIDNKYLNASGVEVNDNAFAISDYIQIQSNQTYSLTPRINVGACLCYYDTNKNFISSVSLSNINNTFVTPANSCYIKTSFKKDVANSIQIELGSQVTTYEPYQSQDYEIDLGNIELCKIGDYKDVIFKNNQLSEYYDSTLDEDSWYIKKTIGKVVLDGSENWTAGDFGTNSFYTSLNNELKPTDSSPNYNYSNLFKGVAYKDRATSGNNIIYVDFLGIYIRNTTYSNVADFKTMLGNNNLIYYYVLATPTYETITNETLISQLESIETFTGLNNFSVSNDNNVLPTLYVSRLKELGKLE